MVKARELGYTEPDPREDLSGADVRRKIIILTRESGYDIESDAVDLNAVLPDHLMDAKDVKDFWNYCLIMIMRWHFELVLQHLRARFCGI